MRAVDVAIVGAGPGGAAAANSIRQVAPHLSVKLYERARSLRRAGSTFGVFDNGFSALEAVHPQCRAKVEALALPDGPAVGYDENNKEVKRIDSMAKVLQARAVPWYRLQHSLLEDLPAGVLELNHELDQLTVADAGVELRFRDQPPVLASVVVGADGNMSQVRSAILDDGLPTFLNTGVWRGIIPMPPDWPNRGNLNTWFGRTATGLALFTQLDDGMLTWQAFGPWDAARITELGSGRYHGGSGGAGPHSARLQRCVEALTAKGRLPAYIMELVQSTDPSSVTEHGQFYRDPAACQVWGKGRVTLLGDAAHLATPFLGQGVNQTLEDAVELGRAIGEHGPTEAALREYERVRMPRATAVQAASVGAMQQALKGIAQSEVDWHEKNPWCREHKPAPLVAPTHAAATPEELKAAPLVAPVSPA